jgi:hypothetical protein
LILNVFFFFCILVQDFFFLVLPLRIVFPSPNYFRRQTDTQHLIKELVAERKHKLLIAFEARVKADGQGESNHIRVPGWV